MKIGIIGNGVVGKATARAYMEFHEVRAYDVKPERCSHTVHEALDSDVVFVCVPERGVEQFLGLSFAPKHTTLVIKSTVPIGTTRRLSEKYGLTNLLHSPEFLTERCAFIDAATPSRLIIGMGDRSRWTAAVEALYQLYVNRFPGTLVLAMNYEASEAVKLFTNAFFATKVSFFNEIQSLCKRMNIDWQAVLEGILSDGRIAHSHTQVPGHDGRHGFGGKCLPKDLDQLLRCFAEHTTKAPILNAVKERNNDIDRPGGG